MPALASGQHITGFQVTYTGSIATGASAVIPFDVKTTLDAGPTASGFTTYSNTVAVTGTGAGAAGTASRAKFTVGGEGGQTYAITVPASFTLSNSGNDVTVTLTSSATTGTLSGTLGSAGSQTFQVGGAFTIPSTQATGNYAGSFTVTTAYN